MSFSDIQLKELEDDLRNSEHKFISIEACRSLLARLEKAEALIALSDDCECEGSAVVCKWFEARDAWRKSCGKDGA